MTPDESLSSVRSKAERSLRSRKGNLFSWISCFAFVNFNIDDGPELVYTYPRTLLEPREKAAIAFSSLPEGGDFHVSNQVTYTYSWRLPSSGNSYTYGYVAYLQLPDTSIKRGFTQRSLVLITDNDTYHGLFEYIVHKVGSQFLKKTDFTVLEVACNNIAKWPAPSPGDSLELAIVDSFINVNMPLSNVPQVSHIDSATLPFTPLSTFFHGGTLSLSKLIHLWELIIMGEPILVFSSDPQSCSEIVQYLRRITRPLPLGGDYRPYAHILDQSFAGLLRDKKHPPKGFIAGATNPLILSQCRHWPHVLCVDGTSHGHPGLRTTKSRLVKKNDTIEHSIHKAFRSGNYVRSDELVLSYLASLTNFFLSPLERYFETLTATPSDMHDAPVKSFDRAAFLDSLKKHGSNLPFRASLNPDPAARLYTKFLDSPNFAPWLHDRISQHADHSTHQYLGRFEASDSDVSALLAGKSSAEIRKTVDRMRLDARSSAHQGRLLALADRLDHTLSTM